MQVFYLRESKTIKKINVLNAIAEVILSVNYYRVVKSE